MKQGTSYPIGTDIAARCARLSYAMQHRGPNKLSVLAHDLGVTESVVSRWRGQGNMTDMTVNNVIAVCDVLDVSADWLLLGRGSMEWRVAEPGEEDGFEPWLRELRPDVRRLMLELVRRPIRQPGALRTIGRAGRKRFTSNSTPADRTSPDAALASVAVFASRRARDRTVGNTPPARRRMNLADALCPTARKKAQASRSGTGPSLLLRETFVEACGYICAHFANPKLGAGTLTRELRCSRATLYRAFEANHTTVAVHIQRVRFHNVLALFVQSSPRIPISTIAADCGFECLRHFSRRFKQIYGMTPGTCRDALRSTHVAHPERTGLPPPAPGGHRPRDTRRP
jgi:AraC-like DNA-binding protein/DNA-binding Xre family transcriptional regulator